TDKDIANFFEVSESTLNNWKNEYPEFLESIKKGKMLADANVAERLYKRALGYEAPDVDIRVIENKIVETPLIKHYPPDPTSAIFWLKNRQPEKWRDKQVIDHTNSDSSLNRPTVIELVAPMVNADENPD
ncbi:TPA: helix-turn-helix domain-containing protein, partial [Pasteurella multocida]|nr:helix-turn-helix domain-containing protein [Pasteurella multocida]